ncbi:DUF2752 domain-containing protein [Poritiphilus flavus]|uniref:DUF2752 domain-containing protein n=1 Tax=Poritiphilus flavus TaxID=2697053 RepID=A0A6L9E9C9_9FLAO|nr:DUF2752 domain-containing protein [Poritiphilus flavus]NAS11350.1 DUF2752 domain-containing protein [Poritiphilus flavus]
MKTISALFILIREEYMLPCFSKQILGVDCPGCGMQRAVVFLMKGEFVEAFKMYPAIYPIVLLLGFLATDHFLKIRYANKISVFLMITSVFMILANFILKLI